MANKFPMQENVQLHTTNKAEISRDESIFFNNMMQEVADSKKYTIKYSFDDIDYLNQFKQSAKSKYDQQLIRIVDKLMDLKFSCYNEESLAFQSFAILNGYRIWRDGEQGYIELTINKESSKFIDLMFEGNFQLNEYSNMTSSYSKRALQLIEKELSNSGKATKKLSISLDRFIEMFDVPTSYSQSDIDKNIIQKIKKELSEIYEGFKVDKMYDDRRGKPVVGIIFSWKNRAAKKK